MAMRAVFAHAISRSWSREAAAGLAWRRVRPRAPRPTSSARWVTARSSDVESPKDDRRAKAGARRMREDAARAADALAAEAAKSSAAAASSSPRARRALDRLAAYAKRGDAIKGFFEPGLLRLYLQLDHVHESRDVRGALGEIGVYHGKSFVPLALLRRPDERCVAVDCFADQDANVDASGEGDRVAFERNLAASLAACAPDPESREDTSDRWLRILEMDSTHLGIDPSPLRAAVHDAPYRIFSVDGCHTAEATAADLAAAAAVIHPEGVVIVDDAFNPDWPGVMTGLFEWTRGGGELAPFAVGYNKVFMCPPSARKTYFEAFEDGARKTAKFMGSEVAVYPHGWISTFHGNE